MSVDTAQSPFLSGIFEPVDHEVDHRDLVIRGELPERLRGVYLRNGANPAFTPLGRYHLFDGDGMLHALYVEEGVARYRNRWVESRGLCLERCRGRALFGGLGEFRMPDPDVMAEVGPMKNLANTHIVHHSGRYLALWEAGLPTEVSRDLDTLGEYGFGIGFEGPMTAHPKIDPDTGELLFFGYSPFPPYLRYHVVAADGGFERSVDIDLPSSVMMHDFVCTEHYAVFFDLPAVFDVQDMIAGGPGISWQPDNGARIGILPRDGSSDDVVWIEIEPCYVFHFLNGWDDGDTITIDGCPTAALRTAFGGAEPIEVDAPVLNRWTVDLEAATAKSEVVDDHPGEFPRINDRFGGRRHRFGYLGTARCWDADIVEWNGIVKHDLDRGASVVHEYGATEFAGEPAFAPDPAGDAEDDGWVLTFVTDRATDLSHLLVLDAHDLDEVARVEVPTRIPAGFHGTWVAE